MITAKTTRGSGLPLCRSYLAVYADSATVQVKEGARQAKANWVIGKTLRDEYEVLGAWVASTSEGRGWRNGFEDLKQRGVERFHLVIGGDRLDHLDGLRDTFPSAKAMRSFKQLIDAGLVQLPARHRGAVRRCLQAILACESGPSAELALGELEAGRWGALYPTLVQDWRRALEQATGLWALPPTLRREVLSGDGVAAALNRSLRKAVDRHGDFADLGAAASFVLAALWRAMRRLDPANSDAVAEHNHHRERFGTRMSAPGV